ncbi:hypothetical protein [Endozoicomonas acroporae]|uniref:hypothetical protein n=1 Tax=Endozoicomonas acroporae TaxID=1701104 RepID=UPI003D7A29F8
MDRQTYSQPSPVPNGLSNIQGTPLAESGAKGQAFSRMVTEVGQPVTNHDMTDQSTSSDNQGHLNSEKKWLKDFAIQNQTNHKDSPAIPVAIPLKNYQVAEYDPENNSFSIYSLTKGIQSTSQNSTDVNTKLNPPIQIPNQDGIGHSFKSTASIAIITPRLKSDHLQQDRTPSIQAEETIDENSSHIECQRELHKDPAYAERKREHQRALRKDSAYAERERVRKRERQRERYKTDPAYAQRKKDRQRERRKDPAYAERQREQQRERQRERRKDPAYAERERVRKRERQRELRKDPAYAEQQRKRKRECQRELRKDPAYAQRERERKRQRQRELRKDPAYAQREREHQRERKKQYRQSVKLAKISGDIPVTSNFTETPQSSIKNSEGTAPTFQSSN